MMPSQPDRSLATKSLFGSTLTSTLSLTLSSARKAPAASSSTTADNPRMRRMPALQRKKPRRRSADGAYPASGTPRRQASVAGALLAVVDAVGAELQRL